MTAPPGRRPEQIVFRYALEEAVSLADPAPYRHLERWTVSVSISPPRQDQAAIPIGDASVLIINLEDGRDVRDFADVVSGQWRDPRENLCPDPSNPGDTSHLLVLERVWVTPAYRGNGLGPIIAAVVIDRLGRGCHMAACFPAPLEGDRRPEDHHREVEALSRIWTKVGFRPWRGGVWMLDLADQTAREALNRQLPGRGAAGRDELIPTPRGID